MDHLIWSRPSAGWSTQELNRIAEHLLIRFTEATGITLEIVEGIDPKRSEMQPFLRTPDLLWFRFRSKPFGLNNPLIVVGGTMSMKHEAGTTSVRAFVLPFVSAERVSRLGTRSDLEFEYRRAVQGNGRWECVGWMEEEFEEYDRYTAEFFWSLVPVDLNS